MKKTYSELMTVVKNGHAKTVHNTVTLYAYKKIIDIPEQRHYEEKSHLIGLYRSEIKPSSSNSNWFLAPIPYEGSKVWIKPFTASEWMSSPEVHVINS